MRSIATIAARPRWSALLVGLLGLALLPGTTTVRAQETSAETSQAETSSAETSANSQETSTADQVKDKVSEIGDVINQNETAREVSKSLLEPIYQAAEYLAFPWFYWVAFALMVAGVISFLGQLVLSKLLLLFRLKLNFREILGDLAGLLISAVGLVLTTQAATENSTFTQSPVAVLSSAGAGLVAGILLYVWGQSQEFDAARAKSATDAASRQRGSQGRI